MLNYDIVQSGEMTGAVGVMFPG